MKIVIIGPPGSGKGTQANKLAKKYSIPHISTGDIFREHLLNQTKLGRLAREYMHKGELVPDKVTNQMVKKRLEDTEGFILDGYPRTINQAGFLDTVIALDLVLDLEIGEQEIIKRISGRRTCPECSAVFHVVFNPPEKPGICDRCKALLIQREDEKPATVKKRIAVYEKQTKPLIKYYGEKGLLFPIDASKGIEEVFLDILAKIEEFSC